MIQRWSSRSASTSTPADEFVTSLNGADAGRFEAFAIGCRPPPPGASTPTQYLRLRPHEGNLNTAGYSNAQLDLTLDNARKATTDKARTTLYANAMRIVHRQRPLIYLWHPVQYDGVSKKVSGVQMLPDGLIRAYFAGFVQ